MKERKILTRRVSKYNPLDLKAYKSQGGLEGLRQALTIGSGSAIAVIKRSGLTGRGGAARELIQR